jgi:hypothetical protein
MAMDIHITVVWVVIQCSLVSRYQKEIKYLYLYGTYKTNLESVQLWGGGAARQMGQVQARQS